MSIFCGALFISGVTCSSVVVPALYKFVLVFHSLLFLFMFQVLLFADACLPVTASSNITARPNDHYTTFEYTAIDFMCSDSSYYLSGCNFTITSDSVCQSHQYDAYLICMIGMKYIYLFLVFLCVCVCVVLLLVVEY